MTNAETNTGEQDCGPVDPSMISAEMRTIYVYISNTLLEEGRRPSLEEVAEKTVQPLEVVKHVLDVFESVAGIYRDPFFKNIIASIRWRLSQPSIGSYGGDSGRIAYSLCAMDALTLAPTLGRMLAIRSACRYCDREISISYNDTGSKITEHTPDDIWIWIEDRIRAMHLTTWSCASTRISSVAGTTLTNGWRPRQSSTEANRTV